MTATDPETPQPPRGWRDSLLYAGWRLLPWAAGLAVLLVLILAARQGIAWRKAALRAEREAAAARREATPVNGMTWRLRARELVDDIQLPGVVRAWEKLTLKAEVGGRVTAVVLDEGAEVAPDETIIRLDARDYRAALQSAEASLSLAEENLRRARQLKKQGAIPQNELDAAEAEAKRAAAQVDLARLDVERCAVAAPFGGIIDQRHVTRGTLVRSGDPLVELLDLRRVRVHVGIPESDRDRVARLEEAPFTVAALGGRAFTGRVRFLAREPEPQARVYRLELVLENPQTVLQPGMFVDATIVRRREAAAVVVPLFAVIPRQGRTFCFVVEEGKARRREVRLGLKKSLGADRLAGLPAGRQLLVVEITDGLSPGERLLVRGQRQVKDGQPVRVVKEADDLSALAP